MFCFVFFYENTSSYLYATIKRLIKQFVLLVDVESRGEVRKLRIEQCCLVNRLLSLKFIHSRTFKCAHLVAI